MYFLMAMPINCQTDTELVNRASIIAVLSEIQQIHVTYTRWKQVGFRKPNTMCEDDIHVADL